MFYELTILKEDVESSSVTKLQMTRYRVTSLVPIVITFTNIRLILDQSKLTVVIVASIVFSVYQINNIMLAFRCCVARFL